MAIPNPYVLTLYEMSSDVNAAALKHDEPQGQRISKESEIGVFHEAHSNSPRRMHQLP